MWFLFRLRSYLFSFFSHFYYVSLLVGLIGGVGLFFFARSYAWDRYSEISAKEHQILSSLALHDGAFRSLRLAESSVSALERDALDASRAAEILAQVRSTFLAGNYTAVVALSSDVVKESERIRMEDALLSASFTAALTDLEKKIASMSKQGVKTATVSAQVASISGEISGRRYHYLAEKIGTFSALLDRMLLEKKEADRQALLARPTVAPVPVQSSDGIAYERKVVQTSIGGFMSDILIVDMNRVKVKTFTASETDCLSDCPVKSLASFVSENGGIAGINGTYFCPSDYAHCSGSKNSFNTLVFDYRSKNYLNSAQNQYSVNPLISFYNDGAYFYSQALGFGRDPNANGVISNHPTLMHNGGIAVHPHLDAKSSSKGTRCGLGFRDKTLWAVCVRGATVLESAYVYQSLGALHAMNLDGGGSAALYFHGYKVGPGRLLPNAVVFTY